MTTAMKLKIESDVYGVKGIKGYSFNGKIIDFIPFGQNIERLCFLNGNSITAQERRNAYLEIIEKITSGEIIIDDSDLVLEDAKKTKIDQIQALYAQHQVVELNDSVQIFYPLKGNAYTLLKDRLQASEETGSCNIEIIDINGNVYQAKDALNSKRIPYIFINALFNEINDISENNRLALTPLIGNSDFGTIGKIQKSSTLEELNAININVFTTPEAIDLDDLINNYYSKTDEQLLTEGYLQFHIDIFRTWKENLIINSDNKYQIFEKINI